MDAIKGLVRALLPDTVDLDHPETILPALVPGFSVEGLKKTFSDIAEFIREDRETKRRIEMKLDALLEAHPEAATVYVMRCRTNPTN